MGRLTMDGEPQRPPARRGSAYDRITLVVLIFASLFGVLGIATDNWRISGRNLFSLENDSYLVATKALAVLGVIGAVLGLVVEIVMVVAPSLRKRPLMILGVFCQVIAVGGMLIACGVFGHQECGGRIRTVIKGQYDNRCGFSYWFLVIGSVFSAEALVFHYFAFRSKP